MVKGFRQLAVLTSLSRILGMLRDMAFAYFIGAGGLMDSWVIAFKIPNLARRIFGEGAAASSLIPVYSEELAADPARANRLARTVATVVFTILALVVLLGELAIWYYHTRYATLESTRFMLLLMAIMLPYMALICTVAILAGILQTHSCFVPPALAPIVLNITLIAALCVTGWKLDLRRDQQLMLIAFAVVFAGFCQILLQLPSLKARGVPLWPAWGVDAAAFRRVMLLMAPMVIGLTVTQINTLADDVIARLLSGSEAKGEYFLLLGKQFRYPVWEGSVSQLFYAQRLYQFPLGVLGISLATAVFPMMSRAAVDADKEKLPRTIAMGLQCAVFVAIPATAGLMIVRRPLVAAIFEGGEFTAASTSLTAWILVFYALGLTGYFGQQVLTRAFYAQQDSAVPAKTAAVAMATNIVLNLLLIWPLGAAGLALSTAICAFFQVVILVWVLQVRWGPSILCNLLTLTVKTLVATAFMVLAGGLAFLTLQNLPETKLYSVLRLAVVVPVAAGVFLFSSHRLRIETLSLILGRRRKDVLEPEEN